MIRIIHNLGGCGGTLLSRCLGVLPGVALLSEINPFSVKLFPHFDPLYQDRHWLGLLTPADRDRFAAADIGTPDNFRELVAKFHARAGVAGRRLILRDYNYVDFVGIPYIDNPPRRRILYDALPHGVPTAAIAFLRHPVDQWLSLCKHEHVRAILRPSWFLEAYAAFLRDLGDTLAFRYEDFVARPETELRAICAALRLEFDPHFAGKFPGFDHVTGDFTRHHEREISLPARKPVPPDAAAEFRASAAFRYVIERAGYPDDLAAAEARPAAGL